MDLELYPKNNAPQIEGYGKGYIKVSGNKIFSNLVLLPENFIELKIPLNDDGKLIIKNNIQQLDPELIIYGSLKGLGHKSEMLSFLNMFDIPLEVMQIGPACRTWSVLIGDGRSIAAIIEPA